MHTDLKYLVPVFAQGVEWWLIFQLFCFILWRFIFTEFMYIKNGMCRVARRNGENKRTKIVEGRRKRIFLHFLLENCLGLWQQKFLQGKLCHSDKLREEATLPPHSHERWHGNMGTGTDFWELISILLPRPNSAKTNPSTPTMHFLFSSVGPLGLVWVNSLVNGHSTLNLRMML